MNPLACTTIKDIAGQTLDQIWWTKLHSVYLVSQDMDQKCLHVLDLTAIWSRLSSAKVYLESGLIPVPRSKLIVSVPPPSLGRAPPASWRGLSPGSCWIVLRED